MKTKNQNFELEYIGWQGSLTFEEEKALVIFIKNRKLKEKISTSEKSKV
jgi:hypothetical protein